MQSRTKIYTVTQVSSLIKAVLENNLPSRFTITGEITDFRRNQSGHCYFSLKDKNSKLPCVMWKSKVGKLKFEPKNGEAVLANGFIEVYMPHGRYQFLCENLKPAGIGDLQIAFEQMVQKLQVQGLFEDEHKLPLPRYPQRVAIFTSSTGAAVGDIQTSMFNRWPCAKLFLYPIPVQGDTAAKIIAGAIQDVNERNDKLKLDIIILGRGGGSVEDLWAFNEEVLARAIYDSKIPIISAVGHEYDTTIADLVADARASTPTKASVVAAPDIQEVRSQLDHFQQSLHSKAAANLNLSRKTLETILASAVFRNPLLTVMNAGQLVDELQSDLVDSMKSLLGGANANLQDIREKIASLEPHRLLAAKSITLNNLQNKISSAAKSALNKANVQLVAKSNRLAGLNPKNVLNRGYSITINKKTGKLVTKPQQVKIDDTIITELAEEIFIESCVTKK